MAPSATNTASSRFRKVHAAGAPDVSLGHLGPLPVHGGLDNPLPPSQAGAAWQLAAWSQKKGKKPRKIKIRQKNCKLVAKIVFVARCDIHLDSILILIQIRKNRDPFFKNAPCIQAYNSKSASCMNKLLDSFERSE